MRAFYSLLVLLALGMSPFATTMADDYSLWDSSTYAALGARIAEDSPSDEREVAPLPESVGAQADAAAESCDAVCTDDCDPCGTACCCAGCCLGEPCRLIDCCPLSSHGIVIGGWIDQGVTVNGHHPANRFNGPVTFNDRSGEYQMNQLDLFMERVTETCGCGFDVGGRIDLLYGTDHRFTMAGGLEDDWNGDHRFYGLAMPQAYLDVAYNNWTVRMGHFYSILGYESVMAPENFFYSHSYTHQYGEPFTHTGALAMYELNDCWSLSAGFHRGWDQWEDNNDELGFLGGVGWTSPSERTTVDFALTSSSEDDAGDNNRFAYSLVMAHQLTCRLQWVLQHDLGHEEDAGNAQGTQDAEWYGVNTYLFYDLNCCWKLGLRYEWFHDDDGARVDSDNAAGGPPNGILLNGVASDWQEIALGLNYKPNANVTWRTECRWDWVDPLVPAIDGPFNDGNNRDQFLWSTDLIVQF